MALLDARAVSVAFGGLRALDDVSVTVEPGEVLGLIGPNGAGKTTFFNVVCGFVRPQAGSIHWDGTRLTRLRPHHLAALGIARTLQGLGLFARLTVWENVLVGADHHARTGFLSDLLALPRADRDERALRERARAALHELGVGDVADRLPATLPYGVQKRVAFARALAASPRLLLLDEPASGLSEAEIRELADLVRSLRQRMAVMLVEHHMDLVMDVCDRVVVLDFGRVIAHGTPEQVRDSPAVLDAYLGETVPDQTVPDQTVPDQAVPGGT